MGKKKNKKRSKKDLDIDLLGEELDERTDQMVISDRSSMKRERTSKDEVPIQDFNFDARSKNGPTHTSGHVRCHVRGYDHRLQVPASDYEWMLKRIRKGKDITSLSFRISGKTAFLVQRPRDNDNWE